MFRGAGEGGGMGIVVVTIGLLVVVVVVTIGLLVVLVVTIGRWVDVTIMFCCCGFEGCGLLIAFCCLTWFC